MLSSQWDLIATGQNQNLVLVTLARNRRKRKQLGWSALRKMSNSYCHSTRAGGSPKRIGKWLDVNGEAIYGTRPWKTFGEGPTQIKAGSFGESETPDFGPRDIRFTSPWKTLFATALGWQQDSSDLMIKSLGTGGGYLDKGEIAHISLLPSDAKLSWQHNPVALRIALPPERPGNFAYVFKLLTK